MTRKAKLEKALKYDDTLEDISAHPIAFRQGRAAEMVRLHFLHAALIEAVEALEKVATARVYNKDKTFCVGIGADPMSRIAREALAKLDKALEGMGGK